MRRISADVTSRPFRSRSAVKYKILELCHYSVSASGFLTLAALRAAENLGVGTRVEHYEFLTEGDVGIGHHEQLEEVELRGVGILVNLDHVLVVLQVDGSEEVAVSIGENRELR